MAFVNRRRLSVLSFSALAAAASAAPASADVVKVYSGLGCRAAELSPAPQPTFNANDTAFNQNPGERLRLLCPVIKEGRRILSVQVRVVVNKDFLIGCGLRTLRNDGSVQQSAGATHPIPSSGAPRSVEEVRFGGQSPPSTGVGYYALECELPSPSGADANGIIMYRVVED